MGCKNTKSLPKSLPKTGCDELPPSLTTTSPSTTSPSTTSRAPKCKTSLQTSVRSDDGDSISRQNIAELSLSNIDISIEKVVSKQKQNSKKDQERDQEQCKRETETTTMSIEEYKKEPSITQEIIGQRVRDNTPYPYVPHLSGKSEISLTKTVTTIIVHHCPILQKNTAQPLTYQSDHNSGRSHCNNCDYRKSQHISGLKKSFTVTPVRVYVCSICNKSPKDLVVNYLSKNTPPMYHGKFICMVCYFRQHGREPPAHFLI